MPLKFSLATLLLAVTAVAILCGLAVNIPEAVVIFFPTLIVWLVLLSFSRRHIRLTMALVGGALFCFLLFLPLMEHPRIAPLDAYVHLFVTGAIPTAIGAFVVASAVLLDERFPQPPT